MLPIDWSPGKVLLLLAAIAGGVCLFLGLSVLQATIAFWTVEPLEFMNAFTYGGVDDRAVPADHLPRAGSAASSPTSSRWPA